MNLSQPNGGRDKKPEKRKHTIMKTKEQKREEAIKANELLKTDKKEQAKLKKQLRKLGLL